MNCIFKEFLNKLIDPDKKEKRKECHVINPWQITSQNHDQFNLGHDMIPHARPQKKKLQKVKS